MVLGGGGGGEGVVLEEECLAVADGLREHLVVDWMHEDGVAKSVRASVAVGDGEQETGVGSRCEDESIVAPGTPCRCFQEDDGVCCRPIAAVGNAFYVWIGGWESQGDGFL